LSKRDYAGFKDIFEAFEVTPFVNYGTFEALADRLGDPGNRIRDIAKASCLCNAVPPSGAGTTTSRPKALFVDEFDQVLSPQLYGQEHRFTTKIKGPKVAQLMRHIYSANLGPEDWGAIQQLPAFIDLGREVKRDFLVSAVRNMLQCRSTLDEHEYQVRNGRIGYSLHDGINFDMFYGYHTAFAHLKEEEKRSIDSESVEKKLFIPINCGEFSYAEILNQYLRVYGVSGTLPESKEDREIVEKEYGILKRTEVPSIFGRSNLKFAPEADTRVEDDESNWYMTIVKEALKCIREGPTGLRSVILTFESRETLQRFKSSTYGGAGLEAIDGMKVQTMTELTDDAEKSRIILKASTQGVVTLITRALGRGTDFLCETPTVLENGGVHVLQTHWSIDKSEEIQIKGRTARQGQPGSYSVVLCQKHLERLGFEPEDLKAWRDAKQVYNSLSSASLSLCAEANLPRVDCARQCLQRHQQTLKCYQTDWGSISSSKIHSFLKSRNPSPASLGATKIVLAVDGTCSMTAVIGKTKVTITEMLRRISLVLEEAHAADAAYEIQIVAYRNYNAEQAHELLQVSSWYASPQLLADFLATVSASYGWGEEAVELALAHANKVLADLVVIIGDADAQSLEDVQSKRAESANAPWNHDPRFTEATHYVPEAKLLAERECPVSTFFVPTKRRPYTSPPVGFKEIASITNGTANILDVNDSVGGAKALTDAVCQQILTCLGEKNGLDLVSLYNKATF